MPKGSDNNIIRKLEEQERKEGGLPPLLEFYQRLLRIQSKAAQHIGVPKLSLTEETISERIEHGLPLIGFDELTLDWSLLHDTFAEVTTTFAEYPQLFGTLPENLRELGSSRLLTQETVKAWFEGSELPSKWMISDTNTCLLESIIHATLKPFLASYSKVLLGLVNQEKWRRRYCPICGGNADFAFLDKERGARWLLCSRCDTEWLFQRLQCPHCGTQSQNDLAYFTDDEGIYRLYVCEQCKRYLKAIDLQRTKSEVLLPLERLLTLDIDTQAQEYGYNPYGGDDAKLRGDTSQTKSSGNHEQSTPSP